MVNTGLMVMCQASLNEQSWTDTDFTTDGKGGDRLRHQFSDFLGEWQKLYLVSQDYKVAVADLQSFLSDLRLWLDRVELSIRASPEAERAQLQHEIAHELRDSVIPAISSLCERFEEVAQNIEEELRPAHRAFGKRQLHPLLLCAPFIHRTYTKPLGYAGDYEMMNMIVRNGFEGNSLFAKLTNAYLLDQAPAHAVRNRVAFLNEKIIQETSRLSRLGRAADIFCAGVWSGLGEW